MDQIVDFLSRLFDTESWPPRWVCGEWTEFHGWLYIASDLAIWMAYFIIPAIIIFYVQKRPNVPFLPVYWLFGSFIILCGSTHLIDALIFWWPAYRFSALVRFLTAAVSVATAFALIRDLPKLLAIQSMDDVEMKKLQLLLKSKDEEIALLRTQLENAENQ